MDVETALALVEQVCGRFVGTLADHQKLQTAITTIRVRINSSSITVPEPPQPLDID